MQQFVATSHESEDGSSEDGSTEDDTYDVSKGLSWYVWLSVLLLASLWHVDPFCWQGKNVPVCIYRGLLCGAGVARSHGRVGSAGAREQPVLKDYTKTDVAVKNGRRHHHHHRITALISKDVSFLF